MVTRQGTAGNDFIGGTPDADRLRGLAGNDNLVALAGNDFLDGGAGNDILQPGSGNDTFFFQRNWGRDTISKAHVAIAGAMTLQFQDALNAASFTAARVGADFVLTQKGTTNQIVFAEFFTDARLSVTLPGKTWKATDFGALTPLKKTGTATADTLGGSFAIDTLNGLGGNDIINARAGNDVVRGGEGNDRVTSDEGNDSLFGENGNDELHGGEGNDRCEGGAGNDILSGTFGTDLLWGGTGNDTIGGGENGDVIAGNDGDDVLGGGSRNGSQPFDNLPGGGATAVKVDAFFAGIISYDPGSGLPGTTAAWGAGYGDKRGQLGVFHFEQPGTSSVSLAGANAAAVVDVGRIVMNEDPGGNNDGRAFIHNLEGGGIDVTKPIFTPNAPFLNFQVVIDIDVAGVPARVTFAATPYVQAGTNANPGPGYVDDIDTDYYLRFSPQTVTLANGAVVKVWPNDFALGNNGEAPFGVLVQLLTPPNKVLVDDGPDSIDGGNGNDTIWGGTGNDTVVGGAGTDLLSGQAGADLFVFRSTAEMGSLGAPDRILDFSKVQGDRIDVSFIDADPFIQPGNQAFQFVKDFTIAAGPGQVKLTYLHAQNRTLVDFDVNGDTIADARIELAGIHKLEATDFVL